MTDFKSGFFGKYASTHTVHRKGEATLDQFRSKARTWENTLGRFLPAAKDQKIVDIGCGNGKLLWWLQSKGFQQSEGIDISEEQVRIAQSLGVLNVSCVDTRTYLLNKRGCLGLIIMRDVLEHFQKDEAIEILSAIYLALAPGGNLIVQVPNAESPFFGRIRYGDFTHETAFCATSLQQVLRNTGFHEVRCYPVEPGYQGIRSLPRFMLWKLVQAIYKLMLYAEIGSGEKIVTQNIIAFASKD